MNKTIKSLFLLHIQLLLLFNINAQNAYIPNNQSSNISVINTSTNVVIATIPCRNYPDAIVVSPDGNKAYVTYYYDSYNNIISIVNTNTNTITDSIKLSGQYVGSDAIDISPDGSKLYYSCQSRSGLDTIFVISTTNKQTLAKIALPASVEGVAVSYDGKFIYASYNGEIIKINATTNSVVQTFDFGPNHFFYGIAITPDSKWVYAADALGHNIYRLNTADNLYDTIFTGINTTPWAITITPNGLEAYVSVKGPLGEARVDAIDILKNVVTDSIITFNPYGISVTPDGSNVYVANISNKMVSVISTLDKRIIDTVLVGKAPGAVGKFIGPSPGLICPGNDAILTSELMGSNYQWQVDTGTGYTNINDGISYSGTNKIILTLKGIPTNYNGYQFRCNVDGNFTNSTTIQFAVKWLGLSDSIWSNPANWSCGVVPDEYTNVIIQNGQIVLDGDADCKGLTVKQNSTITVNQGHHLTIHDTVP